ncbi:MAG: ATP-dependent DNA helicase RecQ [Oscillospiraceae bacterium]|nr:ATP-dependent DNA helicase RecQ [Oscillospiraceae bacterium]
MNEQELLENVRSVLHIEESKMQQFKSGQYETICAVMKGRDALIIMPTGNGKSVCFQYPAAVREGVTIVIEPLNALIKDQVEDLQKAGISACYITHIHQLPVSEAKIYYVSPEIFLSPVFIRFAQNLDISMIVIDEAHCVSLWGHTFRPRYLKIGRIFRILKKRPQVVALTATANPFIKSQIKTVLGMKEDKLFEISYETPDIPYRRNNISLYIKEISDDNYCEKAVEILGSKHGYWESNFLQTDENKDLNKLNFAYKCLFPEEGWKYRLPYHFTTGNPKYDKLVLKWRICRKQPNQNFQKWTASMQYHEILNHVREIAEERMLAVKIEEKLPFLLEDLLAVTSGTILVYCSSVKTVEKLYQRLKINFNKGKKLKKAGITLHCYHGQLKKEEKKEAIKDFSQAEHPVMIATNAFGMGINSKVPVRRVIHFEIPRCIEDYFQEVGRAGRDDQPADAILYNYTPDVQDMNGTIRHEYISKLPDTRFFKTEEDEKPKDEYTSFLYRLESYRFRRMKKYLKLKKPSESGLHMFLDSFFKKHGIKADDSAEKEIQERIRNFPSCNILTRGICSILRKTAKQYGQTLDKDTVIAEVSAFLKSDCAYESQYLSDYIAYYFVCDHMGISPEMIDFINQRVEKLTRQLDFLYFPACSPALAIRDKTYTPNVLCECRHSVKSEKITARFQLSQELDFFDLIIASAVYTLGFHGVTSISAKKIFIMITGDYGSAPEPEPKREIQKRLLKMMQTDAVFYDNNGKEFRGKFLALTRKTDTVFQYTGTPPLFEFAVHDDKKVITIPASWLKITENDKKTVADNFYNIIIKIYIIWRISVLKPDFKNERPYHPYRITFSYGDKGLFHVIEKCGICSRKKQDYITTITRTLTYYSQIKVIQGYKITEKNGNSHYGAELFTPEHNPVNKKQWRIFFEELI